MALHNRLDNPYPKLSGLHISLVIREIFFPVAEKSSTPTTCKQAAFMSTVNSKLELSVSVNF